MGAQDSVLVTGAFGLVGRHVVERLVADGVDVVATAHRTATPPLPAGVDVRTVDLTDRAEVESLLSAVSPSAVIHLAAIIPPDCYAHRAAARAINVDATAALVRAAEALTTPPRFVQASSVAVHGSRNPHRHTDLLTAASPVTASDLYSCHKIEAEEIVRSSRLDWVILRLGGVLPLDPLDRFGNLDSFYFGALLPQDNRVHTVDCRDVASAFAAALTTDAVREVFMVAGDDSHKTLQGDIVAANCDAIGMSAAMFPGRPGNPDSDADWYPLDWMDTGRAQQTLRFQHHSSADMYAEIRTRAGWKPRLLKVLAPALSTVLRRRSPYHDLPGEYADPWGRLRARWGDPSPDASR